MNRHLHYLLARTLHMFFLARRNRSAALDLNSRLIQSLLDTSDHLTRSILRQQCNLRASCQTAYDERIQSPDSDVSNVRRGE
jgi:hypothetical protein